MTGRSAFVYSPEYVAYKLSDEHPLNPIRLELTETLIGACGLLDVPSVFRAAPRPASDDELLLAHDREYIERVRELGRTGGYANPLVDFGLGSADNPVFCGMHEASALVTGGSLVAAELVMGGQATHAFNIGGGLHHANRHLASGFCVYNDCAVAIAWLRKQGARVLYVDTDAHHGDGVQWIFYEDPNVLTISFHESGRYLFPGTGGVSERGTGAGFGSAVNVPLQPYTDHASFVECYDMVVPDLARAFRPDVIVTQNGCDGHAIDPLTHLHYLTRTFEHVARRSHALAHDLCEGRLIALGGGGYGLWTVVPRAWASVWAALSGQPLPENVPTVWCERWQVESPLRLPMAMHDSLDAVATVPRQFDVTAQNRNVASEARARGLPGA
ncbi:MAG: acetoin utilization protein AcuC [Chloroflexi bacterium]|nr:acetoin utilization protein AcuC [Chloroflexota bacterium]